MFGGVTGLWWDCLTEAFSDCCLACCSSSNSVSTPGGS